jgi:DNA-binding XRE family transcriptional regulator
MSENNQPPLFTTPGNRSTWGGRPGTGQPSPAAVHEVFDPTRLTQARNLVGMTKRRLADELGVTPAAVSQYEMGTNRPRPDLLPRLAEILEVPLTFFLSGRLHARLDLAAPIRPAQLIIAARPSPSRR